MFSGRLAIFLLSVTAFFLITIESTAGEFQNSGFESGKEQWEVHVYGAQSSLETDPGTKHDGQQSLRISAMQPSDTALGQELMLRPRRWYRFSGWVKTRDLDPMGAPVFGTFQIQLPSGKGVIASGENHKGNTDWTEVSIDFEAPSGGRTRICPFFVGYGKGTGTAWFDQLKIEEIELSAEPIRITREPLPGKISPMQYGQFIEYLCDLVPSMWAEKLDDGSFEGLSPYKFAFIRETDFKEHPWRPFGQTKETVFTLDRNQAVSGQVSQRIVVKDGSGTVGVMQEGIAVSSKIPCQFSVYLRNEGQTGPVHVKLHDGDRVLASCVFDPGSEWKKFQARLIPTQTATNASLSISMTGRGGIVDR